MTSLVKHFENTMKGIPQLSNAWGSMINLLDAVLVNGFNHVSVLGLSKSTSEAITATINLGSDHGFIDRQVIRIAGSTNGWDGDYKILSADVNAINIECAAENLSMITGAATCFAAPLDFEIVYQTVAGSSTPKRAYRSKDPESLGLILLVHDFCNVGASTTGAKFAKVGVVSSMSDIDSISGVQMPFDSGKPNANWEWDGQNHGWSKWYYKMHSTAWGTDADAPADSNESYLICGNKNSFIYELGLGNNYECYGFLEFYDTSFSGKNLVLLAHGLQGRTAQSLTMYKISRSGISYLLDPRDAIYGANTSDLKGVLWFNSEGLVAQTKTGLPLYMTAKNLGISGLSISEQLMCDFVIFNGTRPVGVIPFIKTIINAQNNQGVDSRLGKYVSRYAVVDNNIYIKYAITMEAE